MEDYRDILSELAIELSEDSIETFNTIAQMDPTDFNNMMKSFQDLSGLPLDGNILNMRSHIEEALSGNGDEVLGILSEVGNVLDTSQTMADTFNNMGDMLNILKNDDLNEEQKIDAFKDQMALIKENGADIVMTVLDNTFGSIPFAGPAFTALVENHVREFVTSEEGGLQNVSNKIGDFFDRGADALLTKTGIKDRLIEKYSERYGEEVNIHNPNSADFTTEESILKMKEALEQGESAMTPEIGFELPDELPKTGADISDASIANLTADLEANTDLLFQKIEKYKSTVQGI